MSLSHIIIHIVWIIIDFLFSILVFIDFMLASSSCGFSLSWECRPEVGTRPGAGKHDDIRSDMPMIIIHLLRALFTNPYALMRYLKLNE